MVMASPEEKMNSNNNESKRDDTAAQYLKEELYARIRNEPSLFEWLQQSSSDGLFYWDLVDHVAEWMSPGFKELFGYRDEEVPNTSSWWQEHIFPEDKERALIAYNNHVGPERSPYDLVVRYKHKDGSTIWVRCRGKATFDEAGVPVRMLGAHNDVTELMRAQERLESNLRMKETELDILTTTTLDGYFDWNIKTDEAVLSDRFKRCLGYEPHELPLTTKDEWKALLHPHDVKLAEDAIRQHLEHGAPYNLVLRYLRKDGGISYLRNQGVAQKDDNGEWARMFGTHTDVTDLEEARNQAKTASLAKSTFLATMSHEIRTPLNAVLGMAQSLLGTTLTGEQLDDLTSLQNAGTHLLSLLNDILDFSQIEAGHLTIASERFNVEQTCTNVLDMTSVQAKDKGIELQFSSSIPSGATFLGDSDRVRQIVFNLVGNSIKFTAEGSVVVIADPVYQDGILGVSIRVTDSGLGMTVEEQQRIFQDFGQASLETRKKFGGSGLGLSICRKLLRAMNGTITLESEKDVGSTFTVWIPGLELPKEKKMLDHLKSAVGVFESGNGRICQFLKQRQCPVKTIRDVEALEATLSSNESDPCSTIVLGKQIALNESVLLRLASSTMKTVALGRGPWSVLSKFEEENLLVLPAFPTNDELLNALSGQMKTRSLVPVTPTTLSCNGTRPLKVLIAEDNRINQKVLTRLLSRLPCESTVVADGSEAVRATLEQKYDLILMDYLMPIMDGLEASRKIRERDTSIPIVALTANADTDSRNECLASGMSGFMTKPVVLAELTKMILDTLAARDAS